MNTNMPPSVFMGFPWNSLCQKTESEVVAGNIMVIRDRLGKWQLTWDEYASERNKDGGFSDKEQCFFDEVIKMIPDSIGAISFSPSWANAAREYVSSKTTKTP